MVLVSRVVGALFLLLLCAPAAQAVSLQTVCNLPVACPPLWIRVSKADDGTFVVQACWESAHEPDWNLDAEIHSGGGFTVWIPEGSDMSSDGSRRATYTGSCTAADPPGDAIAPFGA